VGRVARGRRGGGAPAAPPASGCYLGAFPGWGEYEDAVKTRGLEDFEGLAGKSVAYSPFSAYWGRNVATRAPLDAIDAYGAIPELRLMPWAEPFEPGAQPAYALQRIIDGDYDAYLTRWADACGDFGRTFNGGGTTTGYGNAAKADGPERYVDAYRHVVELFRARGVTNVTWVWQVNNDSYPTEDWNRATAYYPGDDYVDWVGISAYGALTKDDPWRSFDDAFASIYAEITAAYPGKPLMLAEWGCMQNR
jgi:hypothetical protein